MHSESLFNVLYINFSLENNMYIKGFFILRFQRLKKDFEHKQKMEQFDPSLFIT